MQYNALERGPEPKYKSIENSIFLYGNKIGNSFMKTSSNSLTTYTSEGEEKIKSIFAKNRNYKSNEGITSQAMKIIALKKG